MAQLFAADDKFADVVSELEGRGWRRLPFVGCPKFDLKWTNYSKVAWKRVKPEQFVNHLQHSILFSQKDKFAELLYKYAITQDKGHLLVDRCFPRSFDLSKPRDHLLLKQWVQYSEAVHILKKSVTLTKKSTVDEAQLEWAIQMANEVLDDKNFYNNWRSEGDEVLKGSLSSKSGGFDCTKRREIEALLSDLEQQDPQFCAISGEEGGNVWICKPSNLSQGRGIVLCNTLEDLAQITASVDTQSDNEATRKPLTRWTVQKYIERPLLLQKGRKFDIRQWVLVTDLEPKPVAFWFYQSYLRFCSRKFELKRLQDRFTHLSNYSVQQYFTFEESSEEKGNSAVDDTPTADTEEFEPMWTSNRFQETLRQECKRDVWTETILPQMQNAARLALLAVILKLKTVGRGFEWLGFDFLVDENHRVWLLEVNVSPDVSHSTQVTAKLAPKATADALNVVLDTSRSIDNGWLPFSLE